MDSEQLVRKKWRLKATMDERARRLWAGTEADAIGWGGVAAVARATKLAISTVRKARDEVRNGARNDNIINVRRKGGGSMPAIDPPGATVLVPQFRRSRTLPA